jgi:hypothetical protein
LRQTTFVALFYYQVYENAIQEKRKRPIIESEDKNHLKEKGKREKSRRVSVNKKMCDSTRGEPRSYYLDFFLRKYQIFKIFIFYK